MFESGPQLLLQTYVLLVEQLDPSYADIRRTGTDLAIAYASVAVSLFSVAKVMLFLTFSDTTHIKRLLEWGATRKFVSGGVVEVEEFKRRLRK
jgi:hypothetical protein